MAIFNLYTLKYLASKYVHGYYQRSTGNRMFFAVQISFFARGPHTRAAVARLPLRQLGFLVHCYKLVCIAACVCGCGTAKLSTVDKTLPGPLQSAI